MGKTFSLVVLLSSLAGCAWVGDNSDYSPGLLATPTTLRSLSAGPRSHPATRERAADVKALDENALTGTESMLRSTELIDEALKAGAEDKAPTALHDARYYLHLARETAKDSPDDGQKIAWAGDEALFFAKRLLARTREPQEHAAAAPPIFMTEAAPSGIPTSWVIAGIIAVLIIAGVGRRWWRMTTPVSHVTS